MNVVKYVNPRKVDGIAGAVMMDSIVTVDGVPVGGIRKRQESYTGIQRGGTYTYFRFYPIVDGEVARECTGDEASRKRAVAVGLVALGMDDVAKTVDADHAGFAIWRREEHARRAAAKS